MMAAGKPVGPGARPGGVPADLDGDLYGPSNPGAGDAVAAMGGEPPSPFDSLPDADPSYGLAAPDRTVRPEDIANLGYENAHILSRLLGPPPAPPPARRRRTRTRRCWWRR